MVLDWSPSSKYCHSLLLSAGTGLMTGTNNFVNPGQTVMAKELHTTVTVISRSVSLILLLLGVSAMVCSPAARIWGKRPGMCSQFCFDKYDSMIYGIGRC